VTVVGATPRIVIEARPEAGIAEIVLNRPAARNALSAAMLSALHDAIVRAGADAEVKAIVLAAEGAVFCAGHDLKEITAHRADPDAGRAFFAETMAACAKLMLAITACRRPVIAAVQGTATAAGCQLVATCDLAVASAEAQFCTPGVDIGLFCSTPMVALTRNVPRKWAMEMLLTGDLVDAEQAAAWGLVNRVVPQAEVREAARTLARGIAAKSPLTVAIGKRTFYEQLERPLADAYDLAARVMVENLLARDAAEGISAFVEKRTPEWKGC
jgi:enoyl-CoA hydratase/carnithine racemase